MAENLHAQGTLGTYQARAQTDQATSSDDTATSQTHPIVEIVGSDDHQREERQAQNLSDQDVVDITATTIKQEKMDDNSPNSPNR